MDLVSEIKRIIAGETGYEMCTKTLITPIKVPKISCKDENTINNIQTKLNKVLVLAESYISEDDENYLIDFK